MTDLGVNGQPARQGPIETPISKRPHALLRTLCVLVDLFVLKLHQWSTAEGTGELRGG